jgi:hypothetical protein
VTLLPTLLDPTARAVVVQRLRAVSATTERRWGTMTAPQMLCHVSDQLRVALGEIAATDCSTLLRRTIVKWLAVWTPLKWPKGRTRTSREMLTSRPGDWSADVAECEGLIERVGMGGAVAIHPTFGPLTPTEWGRLCWKHLDHHLRQFAA